MGNTCKPMAVSFQCMTKFTTKKKKKKLGLKNLLHRRLLKGSANAFHCSINACCGNPVVSSPGKWWTNTDWENLSISPNVFLTWRLQTLSGSLFLASDLFTRHWMRGTLQMCSWCWPPVMEHHHQCWGNSNGPHACNDGFILCSSEGRLISFVHRHTGRGVFYCLTHRSQSGWKLAIGGKIAENKMIVLKAT